MQFARTADEVTSLTEDAIAEAERLVATAVDQSSLTWDTVLGPLDEATAVLGTAYGRGAFLANVHPDPELRDAARAAEQRIQQWQVGLVFRDDLAAAVRAYAATDDAAQLEGERARMLAFVQRDLRRAGHDLDPDARAEMQERSERLVELGVAFQRNLADHENPLTVTRDDLVGLPDAYVEGLAAGDEEGTYLVTLAYPDVVPFMERAERRDLRQELDRRFTTRAEEPNRVILAEAVEHRARIAELLGQPSWAHHKLEERMARQPSAVWEMYEGLVPALTAAGHEEIAVMQRLLAEETGVEDVVVQRWDWQYLHTRLQREEHGIDGDEVAAHFPLEQVLDGLFALTGDVFGIDHEPLDAEVWHEDVRSFTIRDRASGDRIGSVHMDLFPREGTYGHAAAFTLTRGRRLPDGSYQQPTSCIRANFTRPTEDRPSLLQHSEVETLFHEYGHILHQVLTRAELARFSGTAVERDFVEAPSQIMQHWCWDPAVLATFARHHETGEAIPVELVDALVAARNLDVAIMKLRQVHFGQFDLHLHGEEAPDLDLDEVTRRVAEVTLMPHPEGTFWPGTFAHIMGGYDVGYYGYLWAEVIGDDLFRRFAEEGPTSPEVGMDYRREILEVGGSRNAAESVRAFLGREPDNTAFLHKLGITPT